MIYKLNIKTPFIVNYRENMKIYIFYKITKEANIKKTIQKKNESAKKKVIIKIKKNSYYNESYY